MRIYVPATLNELDTVTGSTIDLEPRRAHTATKELVAQYAAEDVTDIEEVEYGAHLAAAADSLMLIAANPDVPWLRLIISVDVPDAAVGPAVPGSDEEDLSASAVQILEPLKGVEIACVHVDEAEAAGDVQGMFEGKDEAIDSLFERELLWYATSEIADIPR
ncbi:DUF6912 family protein [Timonella senegalensis]|uniref:DUF6912 family protein n=1 Tax=Timonella senegalensis TaxID=1465825 RepID=UPI0028AE94F1|nr:hypothetical protein [Timonella senegalensis]